MDCIVSNLYRTSPSTEKNPLDAVAKSTACGYDPILHRPPLLVPIHSGPFRPVWSVPSPYTRKLSSPLSTLRAPVR